MADEKGETPVEQVSTNPGQPTTPEATDETFDAARAMELIRKLRDENKGLKGRAKKLEEIEAAEAARKEAELTEAEKLRKELEQTKSDLARREREALQATIAAKVGIPAALAGRLTGETPEDMEADAKTILAEIQKAAKPTAPPVGATNPGTGATQTETLAQKRERLFGGKVDIFGAGGGINWGPDKPD